MMYGRITLPRVFSVHPIGQRGEDVEGVPADGQCDGHHRMDQGRGDGGWQHPGEGPGHVVQEDGAEHAGEQEGGVVVVDVEDTPHGPEGDVVQGPAQEQPGRGDQGHLPLLDDLGSLHHAPLGLQVGVGVHDQEYQQEHQVTPPDDWVTKQKYSGFVISS